MTTTTTIPQPVVTYTSVTTTVPVVPVMQVATPQRRANRCALWFLHISNVVIFVIMINWPFNAYAAAAILDLYCDIQYYSCSSSCENDAFCSIYENNSTEVTYNECRNNSSSYTKYTCAADSLYRALGASLFVFISIGIILGFIRFISAIVLCGANDLPPGNDCCSTTPRNVSLSMIGDSVFFRFLHCNQPMYDLSMERYDNGEFFVFGNWWWITDFVLSTAPTFICGFILMINGVGIGIFYFVALILYITGIIIKAVYRGKPPTTVVVTRVLATQPVQYAQTVQYAQPAQNVQYAQHAQPVQYAPPATAQYPQPATVQYTQPATTQYPQPAVVQYVQPATQYAQPVMAQHAQPNAAQYAQNPASVQAQPQVMVQRTDGTLAPVNVNEGYQVVESNPHTPNAVPLVVG